MAKYIATVGMNYHIEGVLEERRVEVGEEVTGMSDEQIAESLELGDIVDASEVEEVKESEE
jgi:hypothetical protein